MPNPLLADPTLELRDGNGTLLIANNDWQDDPAQAAELIAAGLAPPNNLDARISKRRLRCSRDETGTAGLVEVYDLGTP